MVASTNVWGDIVKQVGGEHVKVTSILSDPNTDPHEFEANAQTAAALSKAAFVVENGLGYDDFMDKLLAASPNPKRVLLNAAEVMKISGKDANPHIWYDIAAVPEVANAIADQLGRLDPADAATFTANAKTFDDSLTPIDTGDRRHQDHPRRCAGRLHRAGAGVSGGGCRVDAGHPGVVRPVDRGRHRAQPSRQRGDGRRARRQKD